MAGPAAVPIERAWESFAKAIPAARIEEIDLAAAEGRYLGAGIRAPRPHPEVPRARGDGYALPAGPPPSLPAVLPIAGYASPARPIRNPIPDGTAIRVDRGTPLARGSGFARIDDTALVGTERVRIDALRSDAIEPEGGIFAAQEEILPRGARIRAPQILLLAAAGARSVPVLVLPRITIVPIGDELVAASGTPAPQEDTLSPYLAHRLEGIGFETRTVRPIADDPHEIGLSLLRAAERGIAIGTGGLGSGFRDRTFRALRSLHLGEIARAIAIEPGGAAMLLRGPSGAIAALPGDPYEAAIAVEGAVIPALAAAFGLAISHLGAPAPSAVVLGERSGDATRILPVRWIPGAETAEPLPENLLSLGRCGGLAVIEAGKPSHPAGAIGRIHPPPG